MAELTTEDIQAVLVSKANIELQNIALRRQITVLLKENAELKIARNVNHAAVVNESEIQR